MKNLGLDNLKGYLDRIEAAEKKIDEAGRILSSPQLPNNFSLTTIEKIEIGVAKPQPPQLPKNVKCDYCGQFGKPFTECDHCGAPIEMHSLLDKMRWEK